MITLRNIESVLTTFATKHLQVEEILQGTPYDVDAEQQVNGVQMLWSLDSLSGIAENGVSYNLTAFFMSQGTEQNEKNENDVRNECIMICSDLMNYLDKYNYSVFSADRDLNVELVKTWAITPFKERFNSLYAGAFVQFQILSDYSYNRCIIPEND